MACTWSFYARRFGVSGILWRARSVAELAAQLTQSPDRIFPYFIVNELPVGISGLFIAAIFAAAISTLDSSLTESSDLTVNHIYQRLLPQRSEAHYLLVSRLFMVLWGLLFFAAMFFSRYQGVGLLELTFKLPNYFYGAIFASIVLARYAIGRFSTIILGFALATLSVLMMSSYGIAFFLLVSSFRLVDGRRGLGFRSSRLGTQWRGNALVPT